MIKAILSIIGISIILASCAAATLPSANPCPPVDIYIRTPMGPIVIKEGECDTPRFKKYMAEIKEAQRKAELDKKLEGGI